MFKMSTTCPKLLWSSFRNAINHEKVLKRSRNNKNTEHLLTNKKKEPMACQNNFGPIVFFKTAFFLYFCLVFNEMITERSCRGANIITLGDLTCFSFRSCATLFIHRCGRSPIPNVAVEGRRQWMYLSGQDGGQHNKEDEEIYHEDL